jgi:hypothetical protein
MERERGAIEFNAPTGRAFAAGAAWEIGMMEKCAGEAGNRHDCGLDDAVTK